MDGGRLRGGERLDRRALFGSGVREHGMFVAYCYYMVDAGRAIVGSVYAAEAHRGRGLEESRCSTR